MGRSDFVRLWREFQWSKSMVFILVGFYLGSLIGLFFRVSANGQASEKETLEDEYLLDKISKLNFKFHLTAILCILVHSIANTIINCTNDVKVNSYKLARSICKTSTRNNRHNQPQQVNTPKPDVNTIL
ncbi:unnamed protein product [Rotaria socialis]|nr:unnamed protein product [Rotaria socialis]